MTATPGLHQPAVSDLVRVSARSEVNALAGCIAGCVRTTGRAELQTVGAGALNQAVKAIAVARTMLVDDGVDLVCVPTFVDIEIDDERRTALRLLVEGR